MVLPLLLLAAGLLAQNEAKNHAVAAQQHALADEEGRQRLFRDQVRARNQQQIVAGTPTEVAKGNALATAQVQQGAGQQTDRALRLFEGAAGPGAGTDASTGAIQEAAQAHGGALAFLQGQRQGDLGRQVAGESAASDVAGIRQHGQRSLNQLQGRLDIASHDGDMMNLMGELMAAYGAGGVNSSAGMLGTAAGAAAGQSQAPAPAPRSSYANPYAGAV